MKYSDNDLENVIALCEQDETAGPVAQKLEERCKRALAYRDVGIRFTERDRQFLSTLYDEEMDKDALTTLKKILEK